MEIQGLDHLVLTVGDIDRTVSFYTTIMNMRQEISAEGRVSLHFGKQKFNLHQSGAERKPHANCPTPGSADLCLIVDITAGRVVEELRQKQVKIIDGPVAREGAKGGMESVYVRDPDGNLVEIASYTDLP